MNNCVDVLIFTECHWYSGFARNAGSYRIASELRENNFSVQVIDFFGFMNHKDIEKIIEKFVNESTLAICFSSTFFNRSSDSDFYSDSDSFSRIISRVHLSNIKDDSSKIFCQYPFSNDIIQEIISKIKIKSPNIKTVYGGAKAQNQAASFIDCFIVDFGEKFIIEYLTNLKLERMMNLQHHEDVKVLAFDQNTDDFKFSESTIKWHENDYIFRNEVLPIEIARGCIFKCAFCSYLLIGKKNLDHVKTMDVLYRELMNNFENYNTTKYIFCDDTFNDSTEKLALLANMVDKLPFKLSFSAYIRPELTFNNPEQLTLLKEIGISFAKMGIESLNTETRKAIGKGISFEKIIRCLSDIRAAWGNEVITSGSFVFGLPKETKASILYQREWLKTDALNYLHCISILPLYINFNDLATLKKSEISLNYAKYNYQCISEGGTDNFLNWYNPDFDFSFAELKIMVKELYVDIHNDPRFRHGGFSGSMIQNSGISLSQIANVHFSKIDYHLAQKTYANKLDEYKRKLLKI